MTKNKKKILITGSAGFIGFHVANYFLHQNWEVVGVDSISDYYDIKLKQKRHQILTKFDKFTKYEFMKVQPSSRMA